MSSFIRGVVLLSMGVVDSIVIWEIQLDQNVTITPELRCALMLLRTAAVMCAIGGFAAFCEGDKR